MSLTYSGASNQSLSAYVDLASVEAGSGLVACLSGTYEAPTVSEASERRRSSDFSRCSFWGSLGPKRGGPLSR